MTAIYPLNDTEYQSITKSGDASIYEVVTDIPENAVVFKSLEDYTASNEVSILRARAYPSLAEQADMAYWDRKNGTTTLDEAITAVKDKYPKNNGE